MWTLLNRFSTLPNVEDLLDGVFIFFLHPRKTFVLVIALEFEDERRNKIKAEKTYKLSYYFQTLKVPINRLTRDK